MSLLDVPALAWVTVAVVAAIIEASTPHVGAVFVSVGGEDWAARSSEPIPAGTKVRIARADGIVLEVTRV